ncbi:methyl-accepting chemotaxis protein [Thauera sp. JM12B12]|uniref:methyl-accepting chemotaxis protein n=1 Tax=Thauera sp. JM12B12 TaxID=3142262 RepID=UPI0031F35D12
MSRPHASTDALHDFRAAADRLMLAFLGVHFVLTLGIAAYTDTWAIALAVGLPALLVPGALAAAGAGTLLSRLAIAAAFMVFSALTIQQFGGAIEAHFGIFVLLAFLLYYRDWRPILLAAVLIAAHHLAFNYLQALNWGVVVFSDGASLARVLVHAAYVVVQAGMLMYMALRLEQEAQVSARVGQLAARIGEGDLRTLDERDDDSGLLRSVIDMQAKLAATLQGFSREAQSIATSAQALDHHSGVAAEHMRQQRTATSDIATAVDGLTGEMARLASDAEQARTLAADSGASARTGARIVQAAIDEITGIAGTIQHSADSVDELGNQSDRVAEVVSLIKDIAGQTNLLALNAAIEAARAGEQGRGFAVVADEVRKLAERTSAATEEISGMIDDIQASKTQALANIESAVARVGKGTELAAEAGASIARITEDACRVEQVFGAIASSLVEQSTAARQIAAAVESVASLADETEHSARVVAGEVDTLDRTARELSQAVRSFRLA